jgi:hypothetical protein
MGGACLTNEKRKIHTEILFETLKGRNHSGDLDVNGRIILNCIINK